MSPPQGAQLSLQAPPSIAARPRILITLDTAAPLRRGVPLPQVHTKAAYLDAVWAAGGLPWPVAPSADAGRLQALLDDSHGLLVTGGDFDIPPEAYGQAPSGRREEKPARTRFEAALVEAALAEGRPLLGICGGMQLINVVCGGSLLQDIAAARPGALEHEQPSDPHGPDHAVEIAPDTPLSRWLEARTEVNSTHHQAVDRLGDRLECWGRAPDGIVEALGRPGEAFIFGAQWHPELLADLGGPIYRPFVEAARRFSGR